jgi:hypothetical protein
MMVRLKRKGNTRISRDSFATHALSSKRGTTLKSAITFLNSNLGIFLLSTVFISMFTWSYNTWTNHMNSKRADQRARQKLGLEIMNRLRYLDEFETEFPYEERHALESALDGFDSHANVNPSWIPHYSSVFPEYEERSMVSLIWELDTLSRADQHIQIKGAIGRIELARTFIPRLRYTKIAAPGANPEGTLESFSLSPTDRHTFELEVIQKLSFLRDSSFYQQ